MKTQDRTEAQLLFENEMLRQRIAELERGEVLRVRVEDELRTGNQKLQATLDATTELALLIDTGGTVLAANRPFAEKCGTSVAELLSKNLFDLTPSPFSKPLREQMARVLTAGTALRLEDEQEGRVLDYRCFPVLGRQDTVEAVAIFARDISDLREKEQALCQGEAMLQNILAASPAAISYIEKGRLRWTNPAMARMFHYERESQYLGRRAKDFYASDDEYRRILGRFRTAMERREPLDTEAAFMRSDGSTFYGQLKVSALDPDDPKTGTISLIADITEKRISEELLRRSQDRYRTLVEESFDGVLMHSGSTITFANSRLHEMLGYSQGELVSLDHWAIYHPDDQETIRERAQARLRGESLPPRYEVRMQRRDGSVFDAELSARRVSFGAEPGVQVWIKDISERKAVEAALRESEERFRRLSDAAEEGIVVHDVGRIVDANEAYARMFGYDRSELIGMSTEKFATPQSWQGLTEHLARRMDAPYEGLGVRKDGSTFWCQVVGKPYRFKGKTYRVSAIRDLTERKKAEEALHQSREEYRILYEESKRAEDLYRSLLNSSADAVVVYDVEGRTQYVNDSFTTTFGWTIEDLRDSQIAYVPESEREATMTSIRRLMEHGTPCSGFETKRTTKDGRVLEMSLSASRYHDHAGNPAGMLVVLRDITESKRLEEQLRQATKMEAIGRLAGGIAHDFNNLLTAVIGYSHLLMQQLPQDSSQHERLNQILLAAKRAAGLTNQLLAFSRRQLLDVKVLDINEVIRGMEEMLRRLIGEDIAFKTVLSSHLSRVKGDPGQIEQILMNLVVNSRDAMPLGGALTIETANVFLDEEYARGHSEVHAGPYVMFAVSDTGCGMNGETLSRVFEPFFTTKEKGLGTGLGLATVYGIVKQHTGHVSVYSETDRGTTFKVYLPQVDDLPEPDSLIALKESRPGGTETILVVEDEETVRNLACEALELLGYACLAACDPLEAQATSQSHQGPIHLLLTDVIMPVMDGRSLYRLLSPTRPEMKVLYTSGYTEDFIVHHGVLDSGVHFMHKPFTLDGLASKVRRALDRT
jgi:two-component system, cell cycle sensor histidine kinase and response regulator CckA